jgi:hypothetical protein
VAGKRQIRTTALVAVLLGDIALEDAVVAVGDVVVEEAFVVGVGVE